MRYFPGALLTVLFICISFQTVYADPPPLDEDPGAPIDGGSIMLVAAATAYGYRKLRKRS